MAVEMDGAESFCSAAESLQGEEEDEADGAGSDSEIDDLEYLTLDLVNVLPYESWSRLLELLRLREDKALDISRKNTELRDEVRSLRRQVAQVEAARSSGGGGAGGSGSSRGTATGSRASGGRASAANRSPGSPAVWAAERADLERRVSALAAERRGGGRRYDALDEDLREASLETLQFLGDTERASEDLPRLLATLAQWLLWASREDLAPRGAAGLLAQVPEEVLHRAHAVALERAELHAGGPHDAFAELPDAAPLALAALAALPDSGQAQRVGLACLALASFSGAGRRALLEAECRGLRTALAAAAKRPHHPEVQAWALALLAACAPELPAGGEGSLLAWEGVGLCASAFRVFRAAPWVLERAAHALAVLLRARPQRAGAAAGAKNLRGVLEQTMSRFPVAGGGHLADGEAAVAVRRRIAEALSELDRAGSLAKGSPCESAASRGRTPIPDVGLMGL